jgi:tripartite-type tricarboxylate transporter receptor subunit TctC
MLPTRRMAMALAAGALATPRPSLAQAPLSQAGGAPVKIVFPFGAGGTGDALSRLVADKIGRTLGRTAIVENRTGADGRIGIQAVKAAAPDGATLLITTGPTMALMSLVHKAPGYDPEADFEPIAHLARFEFCLVVANTVPAKTVAEFVTWAKANPDKATYAVPSLGTIPHFAGVALSKLIGVEMARIAYRGGAPAMNDLVAGQVPIGFMTLSDALQQHKGGLVRMLATLGKSRSPFVPEVPTLTEAGYAIAGDSWYGLWAPAKTPKDTIALLSDAVRIGIADAVIAERFLSMGLIATGLGADDLTRERRSMAALWAPAIAASGFTLEQ